MLASPNVSTAGPSKQFSNNLSEKSSPKKAPFFGAFEGLIRQLQKAAGNENRIDSKEGFSLAKRNEALLVATKHSLGQLHAQNSEGVQKKSAAYNLQKDRPLKESLHTVIKRPSSPVIQDAEALQKDKNLTAKKSDDSTKVQSFKTKNSQGLNIKNKRTQGVTWESEAEQEIQALAIYNGMGLQNSKNRIKSEKSEENQDVKTKKTDKFRDRRKERIDVEVYDLRTQTIEAKVRPNEANNAQDNSIKMGELTVHLKDGAEKKSEETSPSAARSSSVNFQEMLAQELRTSMKGDIVRHASMVLKDGGEGLIRLNLKPESLGTVRIKLEMADNKVTGHILVESDEALRAFEKEIHSLEQAFKDGGFHGASLEISVSADGRGSGNPQQDHMQQPFYSDRLVASAYDGTMPELIDQNQNSVLSSESNVSINMLA